MEKSKEDIIFYANGLRMNYRIIHRLFHGKMGYQVSVAHHDGKVEYLTFVNTRREATDFIFAHQDKQPKGYKLVYADGFEVEFDSKDERTAKAYCNKYKDAKHGDLRLYQGDRLLGTRTVTTNKQGVKVWSGWIYE